MEKKRINRRAVTIIVDREFLGPLGLGETMLPVIYEDLRRRIAKAAHSTEADSEDKLYAENDQANDPQGGIHDG